MRYLSIIIALVLTASCGKENINCNYQITAAQITTYTDSNTFVTTIDTLTLSSAIGYGFYCDTTYYTPSSYEQALKGILTERTSGQQLSADLQSSYDNQTGLLTINGVKRLWVTILVCDLQNKIYGYRRFKTGDGLDKIVTSAYFYPQKFETSPDTTIIANGWVFKK